MSHIRKVNTTISNGIPASFTKTTASGGFFNLTKGQLTKARLRPQILNEHAESSREIMDVINVGTIVGQVFKASADNINSIQLTLESAASVVVDDFEGYANDPALQAAWVASDGTNLAILSTAVVYEGSQSMFITTVDPGVPGTGNSWDMTGAPQDLTNYTAHLHFQSNADYKDSKLQMTLGDGVNTKYYDMVYDDGFKNIWQNFIINETAFTEEVPANPVDMTAVTILGFRVYDAKNGKKIYIDSISHTPPPGSINLKLWDMGKELPVADGASFDLTNNANQYLELGDKGVNGGGILTEVNLELLGGKRLYNITSFIAGVAEEIPDNTILNIDNYYAITLHYVDTDVNVFGPNTAYSIDYYKSGYAFFTSAENVDITKIPGAAGAGAYSDLMFTIFSTQDVYINTVILTHDSTPGSNAVASTLIENKNMEVTDIITQGIRPLLSVQAEYNYRVFLLPKGGKFEVYYNDDNEDLVTQLSIILGYIYEPPTVHG